jgi:predicted nucleic acid-binding protein
MIAEAVVDASIAAKWVLDEPDSARARALSEARLLAPDLMPVECANILWKRARKGELTKKQAGACLQILCDAPVFLTDSRELLGEALKLAVDLHHPLYDCLYLALASARGLPLVTADARLVQAVRGRKLAIPVLLLSELPV